MIVAVMFQCVVGIFANPFSIHAAYPLVCLEPVQCTGVLKMEISFWQVAINPRPQGKLGLKIDSSFFIAAMINLDIIPGLK